MRVPAGMVFPGSGLAKAQGLYQLSLVRTCEGQELAPPAGAVPPALNGSPIRTARAEPPEAVEPIGLMPPNGSPPWPVKVALTCHPPTARSSRREVFR